MKLVYGIYHVGFFGRLTLLDLWAHRKDAELAARESGIKAKVVPLQIRHGEYSSRSKKVKAEMVNLPPAAEQKCPECHRVITPPTPCKCKEPEIV